MQREAAIHENSPAAAFSMNLKQHLPMLLEGLFAQIKSVSGLFLTRRLPEDYSFDSDSGIDADADMYRNSLKRVVVSLIRLYPAAYLDFIDLLFRSVVPLEHFTVAEWRDAEAAVTFVYYFGDGCNVTVGDNPYKGVRGCAA